VGIPTYILSTGQQQGPTLTSSEEGVGGLCLKEEGKRGRTVSFPELSSDVIKRRKMGLCMTEEE
jgi:hypothetical protein